MDSCSSSYKEIGKQLNIQSSHSETPTNPQPALMSSYYVLGTVKLSWNIPFDFSNSLSGLAIAVIPIKVLSLCR